jgi:hypothetical protein
MTDTSPEKARNQPSAQQAALVKQYFVDHPEQMDGVKRATFAYHRNHRETGAHYFLTSMRDARCQWCGRAREMVRWDEYRPECSARPKWADEPIKDVVGREELLFLKVLVRAEKLAREVDVTTLTGEALAHMHHTYGVDPSMLECALIAEGRSLPQNLHDDYQRAYEVHRDTGREGLVRQVVVAKIAEPNKSS